MGREGPGCFREQICQLQLLLRTAADDAYSAVAGSGWRQSWLGGALAWRSASTPQHCWRRSRQSCRFEGLRGLAEVVQCLLCLMPCWLLGSLARHVPWLQAYAAEVEREQQERLALEQRIRAMESKVGRRWMPRIPWLAGRASAPLAVHHFNQWPAWVQLGILRCIRAACLLQHYLLLPNPAIPLPACRCCGVGRTCWTKWRPWRRRQPSSKRRWRCSVRRQRLPRRVWQRWRRRPVP